MVRFHILDVHSLDFKNEYEDEFEKKGKYEPIDNDNDDNDSVGFILKTTKNTGNNDYNSKYEMVIHLFGMTDDNKSIRVSVNGFEPYFYVEIPSVKAYEVFKDALKMKLQQKRNLNLYNRTKFELVKKEKLFGYTNRTNFPFVKLSVSSIRDFRTLKYMFLSDKNSPIFDFNGDKCKVYEANLDPMLRFFHITNINPCGWAEIDTDYEESIDIDYSMIKPLKNPSVTVAPFRCGFWDIECYSASGDFPLPKKTYEKTSEQLFNQCKTYEQFVDIFFKAISSPESPPANIDGIYLKTKTPKYDSFKKILEQVEEKLIELFENKEKYSSEDLFKLLKILGKQLPISGDPVVQIGIVTTNGSVINEKHIFVFGTCSSVDNVVVHSFSNEKEMIEAFMKFACAQNLDIMSGYNVFGFDNKYLYNRMQELNITNNEDFQNLSRIIDIIDPSDTRDAVELQEKFLSSSALGDNTLYLWTTTGRLHIDLYYYIKRIENLSSYKLDDVTRHYMSGKLKSIDISNPEKWYIYTSSTKDAEVGKYIVLLDDIGDTIIDKRKIIDIIDNKSLVIEPPVDKVFNLGDLETVVKWAIVKDDVSPAELFKLHRGNSDDRATIAKYCIQDCVLVQQLYNKLDVFNNAMAMANTCSVPINYIFTRGQGIKCESLIFKECALRNQLIEVLPTPMQKEDPLYKEESYEGAIVLVPEPNFYSESPIGVADFASLYPSTIISENISYDTLLWSKDFDMDYNFLCYSFGSIDDEKYLTSDVKFTDIEFDILAPDPNDTRKNPVKVKTGIRICRYVQQENDAKGTLPDILEKLLVARKTKRKESEKETDPFRKALLDAEQLAYKLTANSLYGQLGSYTFKIRLQHLAASTTAYGRKQILFAKVAIETFYGVESKDPRCVAMTVYGDTDSLFINFNVTDPVTGEKLKGRRAIEETMKLTEEAGKFVTRCLKKPHDFEYDKVFYPFIIFSKKRYVGNKFEESPDDFKQTSMGIATKRRDYAAIVKNVYGGAIHILLNEKDPVKAFHFVQKTCNDLVDGKLSYHQITLSKSLRSEYKAITPPAHKILAERIKARDPGNAPSSGDRLEFMYIIPDNPNTKLQGDRVETLSFIKENKLKIDYKYYIEHQIYNPITQLFGLFVEQLPGYVKSSKELTCSEKEELAGNLLFSEIYSKCNKENKHLYTKRFADKFGFTMKDTKVDSYEKNKEVKNIVSTIQMKQSTLNFSKLDSYLNTVDKKKKK
jgi:DNA polymerase elongation subunit (family B)